MTDFQTPHQTGFGPVLLVGLRNPGSAYLGTRHNLGAEVLDLCAAALGCSLRRDTKVRGQLGTGTWMGVSAHLLKPSTWMNDSGYAVGAAVRFYRLPIGQILIIADDVSLPFGALRLRLGGSSGGHNGLKSVQSSLNSDAFARLRVGIGQPHGRQSLDAFVLSPFSEKEREELMAVKERACAGALMWMCTDPQKAMSKINVQEPSI